METMNFSGYTHRFLARIVIEAKTPFAVGSGEKDILTDALVATDVNGLPYIPGTAIAGVVRHMIGEEQAKSFFGYQSDDGRGSQVIFSEAKILNSQGQVVDGLSLDASNDTLLKPYYGGLPIRQHVRINGRGVTDKAGKFDEQIVFAGTRFCFEMEMVAAKDELSKFNLVLQQLQNKAFRIGGGTRCGFGKIEIVELYTSQLDLTKNEDLELYLGKSSKLSKPWNGWGKAEEIQDHAEGWTRYKLTLTPEDFFLFGSGFGDDEADMTPVKEKKVVWSDGKGELSDDLVLIPATSVKGALAHRTAFHWNRINHYYAGSTEAKVGKENPAVKALFGSEGEKGKDSKMVNQIRGNLLFSDVIGKLLPDKVLNHVAIDRFTGGAMGGALFSEKTTFGKGQSFELVILASTAVLEKDEDVREAFEAALKDICNGMLPLGGGINRGNGVFKGTLTKDGKQVELKL